MKNKVIFHDLGQVPYKETWDFQQTLLKQSIEVKRHNRKLPNDHPDLIPQTHHLIFCEHPPVYTLGRNGAKENLLLNEPELKDAGFEYFKINRGGDITYHGPGQIVAYPIFDLDCFFTDVHRYVRYLEEIVIKMLAEYQITGLREKGYTGVWLAATDHLPKRKICAIGVHLSRWVTMHGFALNVNTQLNHFNNIIPCGIAEKDKDVTSMQKELGRPIDIEAVKAKLKYYFSSQFDFEYEQATSETIGTIAQF